jgi:hypothetical protein
MSLITTPHPQIVVWVGIAALVAWRLYKRIRRLIGRQRFSPFRPWFTAIVFPLIFAALFAGSLPHAGGSLALLGGAAVGVALGCYGLRLTRFEVTPDGRFYTPSAHLGIALSLLMVLRLGYRAVHSALAGGQFSAGAPADFVRSPLTLLIFGTLAGCYVSYAIGLLRWRAAGDATPPPPAG